MDIFLKLCAAGLIGLILALFIEKEEKHIAVLMSVVICSMLIAASTEFLQPILKLIRQLQRTAALDSEVLSILLKAVAVSLISEFTCLLCTEAGYSSIGKAIQTTGTMLLLYFALPLFSNLLRLISELLGGL